MGRVDTVIAIIGIVLLVAAGTGLVYSQEWSGLEEYHFAQATDDLPALTFPATPVAEFEWAVLDNTTGANLTVTVTYDGQAVQGGNAAIGIELVAPSGEVVRTQTEVLAVQPLSNRGFIQFEVNAGWLAVPEDVRSRPDNLPGSEVAVGPLTLRVTVDGPADTAGGVVGPLSFAVEASGVAHYFQAQSA